MIKGYKALLDQNSIHNSEQMKSLEKNSNFMQNIIQNLSKVEKQIQGNLANVKNCLLNVENKAIRFLQMLEQDLDNFLQVYQHQKKNQHNHQFQEQTQSNENQETNKKSKIHKNKIQNIKNKQLLCSCGFKTQNQNQYSIHINTIHQNKYFYLNSSHFISSFGNLIQTPFQKTIQIQNNNQQTKTPIRLRGKSKEFDKKTSEEVTKTKLRTQSSENIKTTKLPTTETFKKPNQSKEQSNQLLSQTNLASSENYYCGTCTNYFTDYKGYSLHLRSHGFILHPSSSHIIVRRKCKPAYALAVKDAQKSNQRFSCACSSHKNMSKVQYIAHVFKWHLGITPRK